MTNNSCAHVPSLKSMVLFNGKMKCKNCGRIISCEPHVIFYGGIFYGITAVAIFLALMLFEVNLFSFVNDFKNMLREMGFGGWLLVTMIDVFRWAMVVCVAACIFGPIFRRCVKKYNLVE